MRRWAKRMVFGCLVGGWVCGLGGELLFLEMVEFVCGIGEKEKRNYLGDGGYYLFTRYFFSLSSERITVRGTSLPYLQYHVVAVRIALKQRRELRMDLGVFTGSGEILPGRSWMDIVLLEVMEHILMAEREPYLC